MDAQEGPVSVEVEVVRQNIFAFHFTCDADRRQVLVGGPWSFDGVLLVLEEPKGLGDFNKMKFQYVDFWIQFRNVPLFCMSKNIGLYLGKQVGMVKDIDFGASRDCMRKCFRFRVRVDISKPLKRGLRVCLDDSDESSVMILRYERLPEYCFGCGLIDHAFRECSHAQSDCEYVPPGRQPYGSWLRATSPPKTRPSRFNREEAPAKAIAVPELSATHDGQSSGTDPSVTLDPVPSSVDDSQLPAFS
ncbi:hypothetical protein ACOSP7_016517 [Xanthoceras sorbifolium]